MSERGLTLIELLVGLAIAAMAATIAVPMLSRGPSPFDRQAIAREIAGSLREARLAAIIRNRPVSFVLDVERKVFGYDRLHAIRDAGRDMRLALYAVDDPRRGRSSGIIRFFPDGGSTGGRIEIDDGRQPLVVTVDWLTGQTSLEPAGQPQ